MILLVTAYTGMLEQGRRQDNSKSYTQGYSKYSRQPRVRTVHADVPADPSRHVLMVDAPSGSSSQHAPPEAAGDCSE